MMSDKLSISGISLQIQLIPRSIIRVLIFHQTFSFNTLVFQVSFSYTV